MRSPFRSLRALWLAFVVASSAALPAQTLDTLVFGNPGSESSHGLTTAFGPLTPNAVVEAGGGAYPTDPSLTAPSDVVTGGLGQTARRLLPRTPNPDVYGGETTFTMAVDPVRQNYFTLKVWGSDPSSGVWLILNLDGLELDVRHGGTGDAAPDPLFASGSSWRPGQFIYRTVALPVHLTQGRTSVTFKIRSMGWISFYDSGAYFGHYQKLMNTPSTGLYRVYTHLGTQVDSSGENQGAALVLPTPRALESESTVVTGASSTVKTNVNNALAGKLNSTSLLTPGDLNFLARCYDAKENLGESWIAYPSGMNAASLVAKVVAGVDAQATAQSANSGYVSFFVNDSWGGYFGPMGEAIRLLWPQINSGTTMSTAVAFGGSYGTVSRSTGWSKALRASLDWGRFNRRTIANQSISCDFNIYLANQALRLVDPASALNEAEALRYPKEACGILPWLGSDQAGGTPQVPIYGTAPYGPNWYMCTTKGTTKDGNGFVGSDYGEMGPWVYRLGLASGDAQLLARGVVMTRARIRFRFPAPDDAGYLVMQGTNPIGERNNGLPGHYVYLGRSFSDDFLMASQGAAAIGTDLLGAFQQEMNDGQLLRMILSANNTDPYLPKRYTAIKAMAQTGIDLPQDVGAADFAWVDEENMTFTAKHGEERIFANLFWRQPDWINGFAKVFHLTPTNGILADVQADDLLFRPTGKFATMGSTVDASAKYQPPDNPINAYVGVKYPVAWRSDLSSIPAGNRDGGRGTGYTFRYGHWLVGINAHHAANYTMILPSNFVSATDLVSGTVKTGPVTLAPKTSAVFYLADNFDPAPKPSRPSVLTATPTATTIVLDWNPTAGASAGYKVKRATVSGGPYTTVATVTGTHHIDTTAPAGLCYYVVSGLSAGGEGGDSSVEASTTLQAAGLLNRAKNGLATASAADSANPAANAFDATNGTKWYNGLQGGTGWLQYDFGFGITWAVTRYDLTSASDVAQRDPAAWQFQGSNDGANWTTLDTQTGQTFASRGLTKSYAVTNSTGYRFHRLAISANAGGVGYQLQLAELGLYAANPGLVPAPAAPAGLTATAVNGQVFLNWTALGDALTYSVKRGTVEGSYTVVATTDQPGFLDTTAPAPGTYFYVVSALNAGGEGPDSTVASASYGPVAPVAPAGVTAKAGFAVGQITLSWNASAGVPTYRIYRSTSPGGGYSLIGSTADLVYTDTGLTNGVTYYYVVSALDAAGQESPLSAETNIVPRTYAWSAAPTNANWGTAANWGGNVPAGGDILVFNASSTTTLTNNLSGLVAGGLVFSSTASAFTLSGNTLSLGGDLLDYAANAQTVGLGLTLTGSRAVHVDTGKLTLSGAIGGAGFGLVKTGAGTLVLTGANSFGGGLTLDAGTLQVGASTNSTASGTTTSLGTAGSTVTVNTATLRFQMGSNSTNTFATGFALNDGSLVTSNDGKVILGSGTDTVAANGAIVLHSLWANKWLQIGGKLTGSGDLTVRNPNTSQHSAVRIANAANTFNGTVTVDVKGTAGKSTALAIGSAGALASASVITLNDDPAFSSVWFDVAAVSLGSLSGAATATIQLNTDGGVNGSGPTAANSAVTLTLGGNQTDSRYDGVFSGTGGLVKTGAGTLTLTGLHTYTGITVVSAGTLLLTGSLGATGATTVGAGATLAGSGYLAGATTVADGATLAPGDADTPAGTLFFAGPLTLQAGAVLDFHLGGLASSDRIAAGGTFTGPAGGTVVLHLEPLPTFGSGTYPLITGAPGISSAGFILGSAPPANYSYALSAADGILSLVVTGPPQVPQALYATGKNASVSLVWTASDGATSYKLYRSTTSGAGFVLLGSTAATTFNDTAVVNGTTYYYVVTALNVSGEGSASAEAGATPAPNTWAAVPVSLNWSDAANWGGFVPGNYSLLTFATSSATALNNDLTGFVANGLVFNAGASAFTVGGNPLLLNGDIIDNATATQTFTAGLVLTATCTLQVASGGRIVLNGVVSDGGYGYGLVKTGAGAWTLGGANTFSGGVTFLAPSTATVTNNAAFGTGPITFGGTTTPASPGAIYSASSGGSSAVANDLLIPAGNGGAFTGDHTFVFSGSLLGADGGNGTFSLAPGTHAASITLSGVNQDFAGTIVFNDNGTTPLLLTTTASASAHATWTLTGGSTKGLGANVAGSNTFALGKLTSAAGIGRVFNNQSSGTATFLLGDNSAGQPAFGGALVDGSAGGKVALAKAGSTIQTLSGAGTYTGGTTVNGGTLNVTGSLSGVGAVAVNAGGTLAGTGSVAGAATVASGGRIAPGHATTGATGTLALSGAFKLNGGAMLDFGLGSASDQLSLTGGYTGPASGTVTVNVAALAGFGAGTYPLVTGATGIAAGSFTLGTTPGGYACSLSASGGTLTLTVTALAPPTGLVATGGDGQVTLTWTASAGASGYLVKRSLTSGGGYTAVLSTSGTGVTDTTVTNGTIYYYVVTAVLAGATGESANSAEAAATPSAPITEAESTPPSLSLSGTGGSTTLSIAMPQSVPGHRYQLQFSDTLATGSWTDVGTPQVGNGNFSVPFNPALPRQFYRVVIQRL